MILDTRLSWKEHIESQSKKSIKYYKGGSMKKMERRLENPKIIIQCNMYDKVGLWLPTIQYSFCRKIKETRRHTQRKHKNIPVEPLHVEANNPLLELRRNELGLKFLYKLKNNTSYIETLHTLDDREKRHYEGRK